MNAIEVRTHIDPPDSEDCKPTLVPMVYVDGEPLVDDDEFAIGMAELDRSLREDRNFMIVTCTCGDAGCAGIWKGIRVYRDAEGVHWTNDDAALPIPYVFEPQQYADAIAQGIQQLDAMYREHGLHIVPTITEWFLDHRER